MAMSDTPKAPQGVLSSHLGKPAFRGGLSATMEGLLLPPGPIANPAAPKTPGGLRGALQGVLEAQAAQSPPSGTPATHSASGGPRGAFQAFFDGQANR